VTLIAADDRAYLTAGRRTRYALGPPEAPLLTFNDADLYGCLWACDVPDGWDAPTVVTPVDRRSSGHGGYVGQSTYEERTLTVEGTVTAPTAADLDAAYRRLLTALLGALSGFVRYTHLDETPAPMGLWVRPTGKPRWAALDDRVANFQFVLLAEDPIKTGATATYGPVRLQGTEAEGGIASPWTAPFTMAGQVASITVTQVLNAGDEDAHATYRISGPAPQPVVQLATGAYIHLRLDLGAADTATVDTADGTVTVNGVNRYDAWGPGSTFPLIPPGGAEVRLRSYTGGADPAAALLIDTAPSWR
jgi:Phage tail protein